MNANANDSLIATLLVGAMLALSLAAGRGPSLVALALGGQVRAGGARAAVRDRHRGAPLALGDRLQRRLPGRRGALVLPFLPPRRAARVLRPHARLPGLAELAVQRLGPGAVARLPAVRSSGRGRRLLALAVAFWPRRKTPVQVAALAAAVTDRRPARGDALVLLLRRLVPAAGARGDVLRRSAAIARRRLRDPRLQQPQRRRADRDLVARLQPHPRVAGRADA